MKAMKTFAALLALAFSLAGCGAVDGSPVRPAPGSAGQGSSTAASGADSAEPEQLAALRQLAGENGDLAGVLYLGSVPERTTDVHAVLDSLPEQPWQFVADIPADHRVAAPGGGRELYCLFAVSSRDTLFLYEKQDPQYPHQTGRELYCGRDGQPVLLLCNGTVLAMYGLVFLLVPAGSISQELRTTALAMTLLTLAMGNVAFALYDRALCNMLLLYKLKWQPKLHKMLGMH